MRHRLQIAHAAGIAIISMLGFSIPTHAQDAEVQARVVITPPGTQKAAKHHASTSVVVWLTAVSPDAATAPRIPPPGHFRMAQINKQFKPHLLVIPLRSTVEFPNLDPFFHNVFSQFNGKKFDLGLYETGSTKSVRFDHEGVSYIFCNIHPEMGAVIVTLSTPYYAIAERNGVILMHHVPPGAYTMHVWAEGSDAKQLDALTRTVHIGASQNDLGEIAIPVRGSLATHKNKFGEDYRPEKPSDY
jgi:plastocyanin